MATAVLGTYGPNDGDFARHVDYIHYNPAKHRSVTPVRDGRHSSFHLYVRNGLLPADWAGEIPDNAPWDYGEPPK